MIKFHSIQRKIEKSDPSSKVILEMDYDDVANLSHLLWECRKKGMLEKEEQSILYNDPQFLEGRQTKIPPGSLTDQRDFLFGILKQVQDDDAKVQDDVKCHAELVSAFYFTKL